MNRIFYTFLTLLFFGCSFANTGFWTKDKKIEEVKKNVTKVFIQEKIVTNEFNSSVKLDLSKVSYSNQKNNDITNDLGIVKIDNQIKNSSKFNFSKIDDFNYFEPELNFDGKNFVFFDDKGNLIKFDDKFKIVWKKNYYSKKERKLKPILTISNNGKFLLVLDTIGKFYKVNLKNGNLEWSKTISNPLNSQIKILNDKVYYVDLNNIIRCYSIKDGSEIWKFRSENSFLKSTKRNSLIINNDIIYFNNSLGDIIALKTNDGSLVWQTPTQSSLVYESAFSLIVSDLVLRNDNIIFSNNRNEFYSINSLNGLLNWKQDINSSVRPIFYGDLIFTISDEGYFFIIQNKTGNIIRITDVFNVFNNKKRDKIKPIGFVTSLKKIFLSVDNGRLLTIDISSGKVDSVFKVDNEKISRPFIFNNKILLVKDNSIIRIN